MPVICTSNFNSNLYLGLWPCFSMFFPLFQRITLWSTQYRQSGRAGSDFWPQGNCSDCWSAQLTQRNKACRLSKHFWSLLVSIAYQWLPRKNSPKHPNSLGDNHAFSWPLAAADFHFLLHIADSKTGKLIPSVLVCLGCFWSAHHSFQAAKNS